MKLFKVGSNANAKLKPDHAPIEAFSGVKGNVLISDKSKSYIIGRKLGAGGFADVYLVQDKNGNSLALKILRMWNIMPDEREEILNRFEREYTCSSIRSNYLVSSYDKGTHFGNPFFVMEYCPNGCLADLIAEGVSEGALKDIAIRILKGLRDLHKEGIIHRDLKPVNILFNKNREAVLTDFGISGYLKSRMTVRNWLGHVKKIFGTVVYMPPEQLNAKEAFLSLGPVTDVFAFEVTIHELLTRGEYPYGEFKDENEQAYIDRLVNGKSVVFDKYRKKIPMHWEKIIERSIHPDPTKRFPDAESIIYVLENYNPTGQPKLAEEYKLGIYILKIKQGDEHGKTYNLNELRKKRNSNVLTIGWRDINTTDLNDIAITENYTNYISRHHATIEFIEEENSWLIRDGQWIESNRQGKWCLSTNGVLVNSIKTGNDGFFLCNGDVITIGDTTLKVEVI